MYMADKNKTAPAQPMILSNDPSCFPLSFSQLLHGLMSGQEHLYSQGDFVSTSVT